jgi:transcriptional regulator with XRE-family HTH domain
VAGSVAQAARVPYTPARYRLHMRPRTALGEYLRARRELVRPEQAGLPTGGRRRVPGLRREELAVLAGISSDYYLRLEQGRDQNPSPRVIIALAAALKLDQAAAAHLQALSQPNQEHRGLPPDAEMVAASIQQLIESWPITPAYVESRDADVLAANTLALALSPAFSPGVNLVRATFLDPDFRNLFDDWEDLARTAVARLRARIGADVDYPRLGQLVDELSANSEHFRRLWTRHDIDTTPSLTRNINHPLVGRLETQAVKLGIIGSEGQLLVVHHAVSGSASERALSLLANLTSSADHRNP